MALIPSGLGRVAQFFLSGPLPCPYLPGQIERKLFTRLDGSPEHNLALNATLTRAGFRRSHDIVYRPACPACQACVPVRVPVHDFKPGRSQRRLMRRNADLCATVSEAEPDEEQFALFLAYQQARHGDSDMARMSYDDYVSMLRDGRTGTRILALRTVSEGALRGIMLADRLHDGFSAVYSFFAPEEPARGLGTQLILSLIDAARHEALPYVYLGYWIEGARKMAYKAQFKPQQRLGINGWENFPPVISARRSPS